MISTTQVVNAIKRSQYATSIPKIKAMSPPHLEAGTQNQKFDQRQRQDQDKKFSEVLNEALKT